jgi:flagellar motor switch protein FliN
MTTAERSWLPRLKRACLESTIIPMVGGLPPFPLDRLEQELRKVLHLSDLNIDVEPPHFFEQGEAPSAKERLLRMHVAFPPLEGTVSLEIERTALWSMMHAALSTPVEDLVPTADDEINEGFGTFVLLAALHQLQKLSFPPGTRPEVVEIPAKEVEMLLEISLRHQGESWPLRILLSSELLASFRQQFTARPLEELNPALAALINVSVDCSVGRVRLPWKSFTSLQEGDVVILDQLDLDLNTSEGAVSLLVGGETLWACQLTGGQLIAEQPLPPHAKDPAMTLSSDDDHEDLFADLEQITDFDDFDSEQDEEPPTPVKKRSKARKEEELTEGKEDSSEPLAKVSKGGLAGKIHVEMNVSLGRISMTTQDLLEIKPGNVLNFPVQSSGLVDLLVGADRIGRGELVQLGDALGVRIVEL